MTDRVDATVEVRQSMWHKSVRFDLGDPHVPAALGNLAKQADLDLGTAAWIGKR